MRERIGRSAAAQGRHGDGHNWRGDEAAALGYHEQALAARRAALPALHPNLARSLLAVGSLLAEQAQTSAARPLLEHCLEIRRATLNAGHDGIVEVEAAIMRCVTE